MSRHQKAVEKLLHGHGYANQLERITDHRSESSESIIERKDLVKSVFHCFSDALSILIDTNDHQKDQSNNSSSPHDTSHVLESCKKPLHKREKRKTTTTESSDYRRHESPNPYNDGFLWRKYGQKHIKESGHQRSYFRCAYTSEVNCEAKKQVQMIQDNPPMYLTTYLGHHKCQPHQAYATFPIKSADNPQDHLNMIRFDHPNNTNISSSSSSSTTRLHHNQNQNQNHIKDVYMTNEKTEEYSSPSQWMSPEVAHALEALEFNPFCTFDDFS